MRQWELFGITDSDPAWAPPRASEPIEREAARTEPEIGLDGFPTVLWTTDATLRFTSAPGAHMLGLERATDVLDAFGLDGAGGRVVEAHVQALGGSPSTVDVEGPERAWRCWVSPIRATDGHVSGTICVGLELTDVLPEMPVAAAEVA